MKVCICGGGNLGHVVAGFIAAQQQHEVCLLTRHPERWSRQLTIDTPSGEVLTGNLHLISSDPADVVSGADLVLLCLPGFSIREVLVQIKDALQPHTAVGSVVCSTGFFLEAMEILPRIQPLLGFQRVPFISRTSIYGHRARLLGYKESLNMAVEQSDTPSLWRDTMQELLQTPVHLLNSFYDVTLSNSNPLLHPSRLFSLWQNWHEGIIYDRIPLFYEEWTEDAAQLYMAMDNELQTLLAQLPVTPGSIPTVLDYYESQDATSLTAKLRSIEAFKGILAPMKKKDNGYVPDFSSRYFTEDFPYGLAIVHRLAHEKGIDTPYINKVYQWGIDALKHYSQ